MKKIMFKTMAKLKFVNCVGAICRASNEPYFETMRQTINIMNVDEQTELAERWGKSFYFKLAVYHLPNDR